MMYEIQLWVTHFLKFIPGKIGCVFRNMILPYKHGKNVLVWDGVHIDKPSNLTIGSNVSINRGSVINAGGGVHIGNDVLIGPNVLIYSQNHNYKDRMRPIRLQGYSYKPVFIEDNVWIAANCIILPGVTIGKNSVIAAGAIVTKNVEEGALVFSNG